MCSPFRTQSPTLTGLTFLISNLLSAARNKAHNIVVCCKYHYSEKQDHSRKVYIALMLGLYGLSAHKLNETEKQ